MFNTDQMFEIDELRKELSEEDMRTIRRIAGKIKNGECILFLGAGANASDEREEIYPKEHRPPNGGELCEILKKDLVAQGFDLREENNGSLSRIAQCYEIFCGDRIELAHLLRKHIAVDKRVSPVLEMMADMPFEFIVTTNYDQLFETALKEAGKHPNIGVYHSDRLVATDNVKKEGISSTQPFLYKIHGDIDDYQSMVITDEDYIHFILRMSDKDNYNPIPRVFSDALCRKSILFVGYRLMDYNLRLLFKTIRWGKDPNLLPLNYSIDPFADVYIAKILSSNYKTHFLVLDSWKIIPLIHSEISKL